MTVIKLKKYPQPSALRVAMNYRGVSKKKLSSNIEGLSISNISNFLNGKIFSISEEKLKEIMIFLDFPFEFIYKEFKPLNTSIGWI